MSNLKTLKGIIKEQSGGTRTYPMIKDGKIPNTDDKTYLDAIIAKDGKLKIHSDDIPLCKHILG